MEKKKKKEGISRLGWDQHSGFHTGKPQNGGSRQETAMKGLSRVRKKQTTGSNEGSEQ